MDVSSDQDRETVAYHFRKRFETWHGIVMRVKDERHSKEVLAGLMAILETSETKQPAATANDGIVYCRGNYPAALLQRLKEYAPNASELTVVVEGSYFDFLGRRWLDNTRRKYNI